ncbi:hypothetical protein M378DRAFT_9517 [Amanita muscaria Koide BX008]|uniref:Uncharacterized protein n=1 Tax=Amanita muscaria (strain Koide BX008) TaxID=946122 RepID=A0A0C2XCW2_AMAMK|nr:hypothetical protein M378DRAFT_9517 [Amanita muscaria Koide BX008]
MALTQLVFKRGLETGFVLLKRQVLASPLFIQRRSEDVLHILIGQQKAYIMGNQAFRSRQSSTFSIAMGLTPVIWTRISPTATFDTGDFNINGAI